MKKYAPLLLALLNGLLLFYPLILLFCSLRELHFTLTRPFVLCLMQLLTAIAAGAVTTKNGLDRTSSVLAAFSLLFSLINAVCVMLTKSSGISDLLFLAAPFVICSYLGLGRDRPKALQIAGLVVVLVMVFLSFLFLPVFLLGRAGALTVVQTVMAPGGEYRAELVADDQGAMGGATDVYVYKGEDLDAGFFKISRRKLVYSGRSGEVFDIDLLWADDACLMIDQKEYPNPFLDGEG